MKHQRNYKRSTKDTLQPNSMDKTQTDPCRLENHTIHHIPNQTTIVRIETASGQNSLSNIHALISTYQLHGVEISNLMHDSVTIAINEHALHEAARNFANPDRKRQDAGKKRTQQSLFKNIFDFIFPQYSTLVQHVLAKYLAANGHNVLSS